MAPDTATSGRVTASETESDAPVGLLAYLHTEPVRGYAPYAGIGSRKTPDDVLELMRDIASWLAIRGWVLRSGHAPGADAAFEDGALRHTGGRLPELYLPWRSFQGGTEIASRNAPQFESSKIAALYHPRWNSLSPPSQKLIARNTHQVLGYDVTNPVLSKFVLCWTKDAKGGGGTGQALRIAEGWRVPIYDLANPTARSVWEAVLSDKV